MSKYSLYSDDCQRSGLDALSDIYSILRVRDEAARASSIDVRYAHALDLQKGTVSTFNIHIPVQVRNSVWPD
jgi:hypothetical protein